MFSSTVTFIIWLSTKISSVYLVSEVDVFKHLRFCDDFSHLVTTRFLATAKLCLSVTLMEYMFEMIQISS